MKPLSFCFFLLLAAAVSFGAARPLLAQTAVSPDKNENREVWDKDGLAFRTGKGGAATYSRELQKLQRQMNQEGVQGAPKVPETGRYNYEMFAYSHTKMKTQAEQVAKGDRIDRMLGIAELLGKRLKEDAVLNDKGGLEQDLIRAGKAKQAGSSNVFDIVEAKLARRKAAHARAQEGVQRYEADANRLKPLPVITEAQAGAMGIAESGVLRWLGVAVLEAQAYHADGLRNRLDPASPDAHALTKAIDDSKLTAEQKARSKEQAAVLRERVEHLRGLIAKARRELTTAVNTDAPQAAMSVTTQELRGAAGEYDKLIRSVVDAQR